MKTKAVQFGVAVVMAASLAACGGGGGSPGTKADPANESDGLGTAGHAAGTVELGNAALPGSSHSGTPEVAIAVSDQGRALAVWQVMAPLAADKSAAWAQTSTTGVWGTATPLPQARNSSGAFGLTLRMNQTGNAVLGWVNQDLVAPSTEEAYFRVARFIQGTGWDAQAYDASGGTSASVFGHSHSSDLTMLDDDSFTSSVRMPGYASAVQRTDRLGQQTITLQSGNHSTLTFNPYAAYSPKGNGYGLLYQVADSVSNPGQTELRAQLASVYTGAFAPFPIGTYGGLCYTEPYDNALVAVVTPQAEGVLAVVAAEGNCDYHKLMLNRVYTAGSIRVDSTRLNSFGTFLPVAPVVAVDQSGNALAVWKEATGQPFGVPAAGDTVRLMWAKSSYGGAWSTPAPLVSNLGTLGTVPRSGHIALAMNSSGEAVASVRLNGLVNSTVNQSLVVARFNFASGWTAWQAAANKQNLSEPRVAINAGGKAFLAYSALTAPRVNGQAPISYPSETPVRAFAYPF